MLLPAIGLDAAMTAAQALTRLALHGLWLDPGDPGAREWLAEYARRTKTTPEAAARRLGRDPRRVAVAIRRQWRTNVLWYPRTTRDVLDRCRRAPPEQPLREALDLHEPESRPPLPLPEAGEEPAAEGVVLDGGAPVAVSLRPPTANGGGAGARGGPMGVPAPGGGGFRGLERMGGGGPRAAPRAAVEPPAAAPPPPAAAPPPPPPAAAPAAGPAAPAPAPTPLEAWPRIDAPTYRPATVAFDVTVGLGKERQKEVSSAGPVVIQPPAGAATIDVDVDLVADGVDLVPEDAAQGWRRRLRVPVADPTSAQVTFRLVGREPTGPEPFHLTTLLVRYVYGGAVCGVASRPLIVGGALVAEAPPPESFGTPWAAQPAAASPVTLAPDELAPDLTIEIAKPDGNSETGRYVCLLASPHPLPVAAGPYPIDLGQDAKSFARECVVGQIADLDGTPLGDHLIRSLGTLVTEQLPAEVLDALREVAKKVAPAPPAVLLVTADPYVPWELALVEPPLDPARPPFLGAQALLGRWLRDVAAAAPAPAAAAPRPGRPKPPPSPPGQLTVRHMAVMAGVYGPASKLAALPGALREAQALVKAYDAVPLEATAQALSQLLRAELVHQLVPIGGADAMHFAGHGDFDAKNADAPAFFLKDGTPVRSMLFRKTGYRDPQQPLVFLNACMIGIGGELLGDMGGFPGSCLKGGFGGLLGALWAVDDDVAEELAVEFWRRVLPPKQSAAKPEPVAAVLRDLRAKYAAESPALTYLAYVFYGHPRLTLTAAA